MSEKIVQKPFTNVPKRVPTVHESVQEAVHTVPEGVQMNVHERSRNVHSRKNTVRKRTVPLIKYGMPILVLIASCAGTLLYLPALWQITLWLLFLAVFMWTDPLDIFARVLAPQSQKIVGIEFFLVALNLWIREPALLVISAAFSIAGIVAIWYGNQYWLDAYNWEFSPGVQRALQMTVDSESPAMQAWISHGKREVRTMFIELGLDHTEQILDIYSRPVYLAGYLNGKQKTARLRQELQRTAESRDKAKRQCKKLSEALEDKGRRLEAAESEIKQFKEHDMQNALRYDIKQLRAKNKALEAENEQLRAVNEELLRDTKAPIEQVAARKEIDEHSATCLDNQVLTLKAEGMSYAEIGKVLGISKTKAYNICKKAEENAGRNSEKVIPLKKATSAGA